MPGLDDTAVEEGLQRLPGWERCGNQLAKTFVRATSPVGAELAPGDP